MNRRQFRRSLVGGTAAVLTLGLAGAASAAVISGVVHSSTGQPVPGATVQLETGVAVSTDATGGFTFNDVAAGPHTLTAHLPGGGVQKGQVTVAQDASATATLTPDMPSAFQPIPGLKTPAQERRTLGEIVVVANRYEATALQMRANNTVNVLSAADLSHTAVHNVAEALGLLPGVTVTNTGNGFIGGVDAASRGEGMYAAVRGLDTEFNVNMINGVTVAVGNPYSRAVQLSLLPPSGLQTVVLNKTSRADMDGDAIGGTIDFRTPSAFDFSGSDHFSLTAGGRIETQALNLHGDAGGYSFAADGTKKFGEGDKFGVYVSGYYDLRHFANSELGGVMESGCCDNAWNFGVQTASGGNPPNLDPEKNLILTGYNVGVSSGSTERYGGTASLDWRPDANFTAYARMSYAAANTQQNSQLSQLVGMDVANGVNGQEIGTSGLYQPIITNLSTRYWYETNPEFSELDTLQIGLEKRLDGWTISPALFGSFGRNDRPDHIEISARAAGDGYAYGQTSLVTYSGNYPHAVISPTIAAALNNPAAFPATDANPELTAQTASQLKGGAKLDLRKDFDGDGVLKYVQFGGKIADSSRRVTNRDWTNPAPDVATFGDVGVIDGYWPGFPGKYSRRIAKIDQGKLFALYNAGANDAYLDSCGSVYEISYNCNTQFATEAVSAAYAEAGLKFGELEVIPGLRFEHTRIHNHFFVQPADPTTETGGFASNDASYDEPLPSLFFNWRPNSGSVYRASVWRSYTRPAFVQLGGGASTSLSEGVTTITQGNPDLKTIESTNYDASAEWDNHKGAHLLLAAYYKELSHYIYDAGGSQANATASANGVVGGTVFVEPQNGGSGHVYGLEAAGRLKFQMLAAPFDGLGVSGNLTLQGTGVHLNKPGLNYTEQIQNAPDILANAGLFYEKNGISADILWNYTGSYIINYDVLYQNASWDDLWNRPIQRVDAHVGYDFHNGVRADVSASNLLAQESYWSHIGKHSLADSDIVQTGRTILMTIKYAY